MTVHPHAYGERRLSGAEKRARVGSSPRIWGTGPYDRNGGAGRRFIPTHMGNGSTRSHKPHRPPVHPHAYGERAAISVFCSPPIGSSPRIWGTANNAFSNVPQSRFIPTHMGNGLSNSAARLSGAVHPHAYGERHRNPFTSPMAFGSSPRIWGTAGGVGIRSQGRRFIPTHMGNGNLISVVSRFSPVHPHAYGERQRAIRWAAQADGSSPRIWGTGRLGAT